MLSSVQLNPFFFLYSTDLHSTKTKKRTKQTYNKASGESKKVIYITIYMYK